MHFGQQAAQHNHIHAKTLFSTHYHELTVLDQELTGLRNVHVGATEQNGELVFVHKVERGAADKSYGVHVAKLAGMPDSLLDRANTILTSLESQTSTVSTTAASLAASDVSSNDEVAAPVIEQAQAEAPVVEDLPETVTTNTEGGEEQVPIFAEQSALDAKRDKVLQQLTTVNLMAMSP